MLFTIKSIHCKNLKPTNLDHYEISQRNKNETGSSRSNENVFKHIKESEKASRFSQMLKLNKQRLKISWLSAKIKFLFCNVSVNRAKNK